MARGWESKSIEAQQAEAAEKPHNPRPKLTSEEAAKHRNAENLRLARIRLLRQLESASSPRYREIIEVTLKSLDERIAQL